jgi:hydroxymethylglutaryl-CoA reductase
MKLHARSVAASAGAPEGLFDEVVARLVDSGDIKDWKARKIVAEARRATRTSTPAQGTAAGKVILLGEHGVVYGRHALALPIPGAVRASVTKAEALQHELPGEFVDLLLRELEIDDDGWRIEVDSRLPFGKGLGSSAAVAVALARAFSEVLDLGLDDERVNEVAFASETLAHGTPSGVDNTLATYAEPMLFCNDGGLQITRLKPAEAPPLLIAWGSESGRTSEMVAGVRARREASPGHFDAIFDEMDRLGRAGATCLEAGDWQQLGSLMNICHGLLNAIGVSTPSLERMVDVARCNGAAGAKLTGAGGGGSIVAICPDSIEPADAALRRAGYQTLVIHRETDT